MARTSITDEWGNVWDDAGYWIGVGANAGKYFVNGAWQDFPPYSGGGSTANPNRYITATDYDGSVTGIVGATYQKDTQDGSISIISRPTSVSVSVGPGAGLGSNRYTTLTDTTGSVTGIPGAVYQVDNADGSVTILSKPSGNVNPADRNNDGLDDTTNLALGVFPNSKSPTGYIYSDGTIVWPNGAPAGMGTISDYSGGTTSTTQWTGYGSKGQGTYIIDAKTGKEIAYIGPTQNPASSSGGGGSSGTTYKVSVSGGGGSGGGGGGGGGSASQYDTAGYRQMTQAVLEREAAIAALKQQYREPDTVSAEGEANRAYQRERDARQEALTREQMRQQDIAAFRSAVSDVDPAAFDAWLYANGYGQGGHIMNRIGEGGNALSANALAGAAALLGRIRGTPGTTIGSILNGTAPVGGAGGTTGGGGIGAIPPGGNDRGPVPGAGTGGGGTPAGGAGSPAAPATPAYKPPTLLGAWRLARDANGNPTGWWDANTGATMPWVPGETDAPIDWAGIPQQMGPSQEGGLPPLSLPEGTPFRNGDWIRLEVGGQPIGWVNALDRRRVPYDPKDPTGHGIILSEAIANRPKTPEEQLLESIYTDANGVQHFMDGTEVPVWIPNQQMAHVAMTAGLTPWSPGGFNALGEWVPSGQTIPTNVVTNPTLNPALKNGGQAAAPSTTAPRPDTVSSPGGVPIGAVGPVGVPGSPSTIPVGGSAAWNGTGWVQTGTPGNLEADQLNRPVPTLARGGMTRLGIVGDRPDGRVTGHEELVIAPQGAKVIPLTRGQARRLMRGVPRVPRYFEGTGDIDWGAIEAQLAQSGYSFNQGGTSSMTGTKGREWTPTSTPEAHQTSSLYSQPSMYTESRDVRPTYVPPVPAQPVQQTTQTAPVSAPVAPQPAQPVSTYVPPVPPQPAPVRTDAITAQTVPQQTTPPPPGALVTQPPVQQGNDIVQPAPQPVAPGSNLVTLPPANPAPAATTTSATTAGSGVDSVATTSSTSSTASSSTGSPAASSSSSAPAGGGSTQSTLGGTGLQTVSGTVDVSSLTPAEQALLDEIAQFRQDVQVPDLNPYDVNFWNINPLIRQRYFAAQQSRLGIPAEAFEWEVGRMRIPGLSRDQVAVGY